MLILSALSGLPMGVTAAQAAEPVRVTPLGSFRDVIDIDAYPAVALRHDMEGTTAYSLTIDATGVPSRCDIASSSGFDVLDAATCAQLMAKARFAPGRDAAGKPVGGTYTGRVTWAIPDDGSSREGEMFASLLFSIDRSGAITACRMLVHAPTPKRLSPDVPCGTEVSLPPPRLGMALRGNDQRPSVDVEYRGGTAFTPALRARILEPMPGYEQRALNIYHFTVGRDGKAGQCSYAEQRGDAQWAQDGCTQIRGKIYDPPAPAFGADGVAQGWRIVRMLVKKAG
ncbi:hypothetical protein ASE00_01210 [Sphingomonas sp. Root710]|nr:hypothetical protein ASE00_01210 [Sphingomonas sp. Root710]